MKIEEYQQLIILNGRHQNIHVQRGPRVGFSPRGDKALDHYEYIPKFSCKAQHVARGWILIDLELLPKPPDRFRLETGPQIYTLVRIVHLSHCKI
jgi:hypothetical protein